MMGRNHIIAGAASFVTCTCGLYLLGHADGGFVSEWISPAANAVGDFFLDGNEPFSLYSLLGLALYLLGCVLPDIDSESSMVGRRLHLRLQHRTWTHSLWFPIILMIASSAWRPLAWLAFGYVVHLFWDSMSRQGVCWFYPHPGFLEYENGARVRRNHWLWLYRANSLAENVVTWSSVVIAAVVSIAFLVSGALPVFTVAT